MDQHALNYNPLATVDDGSCTLQCIMYRTENDCDISRCNWDGNYCDKKDFNCHALTDHCIFKDCCITDDDCCNSASHCDLSKSYPGTCSLT